MTIQQRIYKELNICRAIYRLINSDLFMECYIKSNIDERKIVDNYVINKNKDYIISWIKKQSNLYNVRDLQRTAKQLGISNWSRMSKNELESKIETCKNVF